MGNIWVRERIDVEQERLSLSVAMHRRAGILGFSGIPKLSSIDKRWFMEVNRVVLTPEGRYSHTHFNVAMGTGDSPIEAAADGYAQVAPEMREYVLFAKLEVLIPLLRRRAASLKKLDAALDDLTDIIRSANVPRAAAPGEDDDL